MFAIDFFCGAGGLTRGLVDAGIQVLAGIDNNEDCQATYERNNPGSKFLVRDIKELLDSEVDAIIGRRPRHELIFAGCAPCQPFSTHQKGDGDITQKTLLSRLARMVEIHQPGFVVIENVPGIARVAGDSTYKRFLRALRNAGYLCEEGALDAKHYGVPQNRRRWVVIASRHRVPQLPARTHGPGGLPFESVQNAIADLPAIRAGETHSTVPNHKAAQISEVNMERLRLTPHNGGRRLDWPDDLKLKCHGGNYKGHTDVYGRMVWGNPAPTLTCRCYSISNGRYGHPEQDRAISLREAARLQTFTDDYVFYGNSQASVGAMIGNAVPVRLGRVLGTTLMRLPRRDASAQALAPEGR